MATKNYYKILQVDPSAEPEVIAAAYKRLALKYHPDTNKELESNVKMQEINAAYQILSDPSKRAEYDSSIQDDGVHPKSQAPKQEPSDRKLIHQSDFLISSSYWKEDSTPQYRRFTKNGYYHIKVLEEARIYNYIPLNIKDFRLYVDIQIAEASSSGTFCGLVFRASTDDEGKTDCYDLFIDPSGAGLVLTQKDQEIKMLAEWIESPHIYGQHTFDHMDWKEYETKKEDDWGLTNRFMVEAKGQTITVGANKKILAKVDDSTLRGGYVGVYVMLLLPDQENKYAEARFRNFKLYSLES